MVIGEPRDFYREGDRLSVDRLVMCYGRALTNSGARMGAVVVDGVYGDRDGKSCAGLFGGY